MKIRIKGVKKGEFPSFVSHQSPPPPYRATNFLGFKKAEYAMLFNSEPPRVSPKIATIRVTASGISQVSSPPRDGSTETGGGFAL